MRFTPLILLLLCTLMSCSRCSNNKQPVIPTPDECKKVGLYLYYYDEIHADRGCEYIDGSVEIIDTLNLYNSDLDKICIKCINDDMYSQLKRIANRNHINQAKRSTHSSIFSVGEEKYRVEPEDIEDFIKQNPSAIHIRIDYYD